MVGERIVSGKALAAGNPCNEPATGASPITRCLDSSVNSVPLCFEMRADRMGNTEAQRPQSCAGDGLPKQRIVKSALIPLPLEHRFCR